tara:strand:+ start:208 stop:333 length:126 start_codon:yes stop_codon:yes gene_type:complete
MENDNILFNDGKIFNDDQNYDDSNLNESSQSILSTNGFEEE